jgi:hypothetical protein
MGRGVRAVSRDPGGSRMHVSAVRDDTWQTVANNLPPIYSVRFG